MDVKTILRELSELAKQLNDLVPKLEKVFSSPPSLRNKKELGQYFTVSNALQQYVFDRVKHKGAMLLEPSFGAGHLLLKFLQHDPNYPMICYEIDSSIPTVCSTMNPAFQTVYYDDFMTATPATSAKFKTIIGNPPYVKQSTGNLYLQFIEKCVGMLDADGGELIFIVPSDFIKVTRGAKLIQSMVEQGSFTDFYFPHDETLFEDAAVDVMVFRYEKGLVTNQTVVNGDAKYCTVRNGIITFQDAITSSVCISELFHVYVGLVSGKDEVYKVPFGDCVIQTDLDASDRFIFPSSFPTNNAVIDAHLLKHKATLLERGIRDFTEKNWYQWGAPRNLKAMRACMDRPCIYLRTITRQLSNVALRGKVTYFGGGLLCLIPRIELSDAALASIEAYLNSADFTKNYVYSGRFKIGQKQLCNVLLPEAVYSVAAASAEI